MIRLEGVTKRYGDTTAVDDLSLEVPSGDVCVLIGPSGCGKTTTLRMINRLIEPTDGRIEIDGREIMSFKPEELRRHIGYVIQSVGLFPHLTVSDNVATVPRLLGWKKEKTLPRVGELLELVGLDPSEYGGKYPNQLSGGEAQRVGVARALAADPPLLLMDEPFGAVDPLNRERLQAEFARIQRELRKTVIFVTHDVDEAIRLADRIALMREGRLQQYDAPEALIDHPANKFVHDFMGADRALKRLGRVLVADSMRTDVPSVHMGDTDEADRAARDDMRFVYLIDGSGHFAGWVDCDHMRKGASIEDSTTLVDWREAAVREDVSLKEALASMLGLGFRSVAVVDREGILLGEIGLADIERTMTASDSHISHIAGEDEAGGAGSDGEGAL